jgi:hypothetical protein
MTTTVDLAQNPINGKRRLKGVEMPRLFTPPLAPLTPENSDGFACIAFAERILKLVLLPWQKWLLIHALELLPDKTYRFRIVVCLVARQNGKTMVMKVLALWHIFARRSKLVIGTAQELSLSERSYQEALEMVEDIPELADEIAPVGSGQRSNQRGQKYFRLKREFGGGEYVVKAANRKARGTSADLVLLDELREHTNWEAWAAVSKTIRARASAQVWALSNAGDMTSVVLRHLRAMGHRALGWPDGELDTESLELPDMEEFEAEFDDYNLEDFEELSEFEDSSSIGLFEFSASPTTHPRDPMGWIQANPSLNWTEYVRDAITTRVLLSDLQTEPPGVFDTECLCRWVKILGHGPFEPGVWKATRKEDVRFEPNTERWICVETNFKRTRTYIARVGPKAGDSDTILADIAADRVGTDWVLEWLKVNRARYTGIVVQGSGAPASSLTYGIKSARPGHYDKLAAETHNLLESYEEEDLVAQLPFLSDMYDAELPIVMWEGDDLGKASGIVYDRLQTHRLEHLPHPGLDLAATSAAVRATRDSWVIDRRKSPTDASPLVAVMGAVWGMERYTEDEPNPSVHTFSEEQIRAWERGDFS